MVTTNSNEIASSAAAAAAAAAATNLLQVKMVMDPSSAAATAAIPATAHSNSPYLSATTFTAVNYDDLVVDDRVNGNGNNGNDEGDDCYYDGDGDGGSFGADAPNISNSIIITRHQSLILPHRGVTFSPPLLVRTQPVPPGCWAAIVAGVVVLVHIL